MAVIQGFNLTEQVTQLNHRVLILWREADPFGSEWAEETKTTLSKPSIEFVVLPHCGHLGWMECPRAFFPLLRSFLGLSD